jgi:hypothetical protein
VYRLQKAFRRNRLVFASAAAIGVALVVSATFSLIQAIRATQARNVAVEAQGKLQKQYEETANAREAAETSERNATQLAEQRRRQIYALDMYRASQYLQIDHLAPVLELLAKHVPRNGEEDLRGFEWRYLWSKSRGDEILIRRLLRRFRFPRVAGFCRRDVFRLHPKPGFPQSVFKEISVGARTLSFSPDDRWLAGASDSEVTIWDTTSWAKAHTFPDASYPAKFSHDGKWLAFIAKQELRLVSTVDWKTVRSFSSIALATISSSGSARTGPGYLPCTQNRRTEWSNCIVGIRRPGPPVCWVRSQCPFRTWPWSAEPMARVSRRRATKSQSE